MSVIRHGFIAVLVSFVLFSLDAAAGQLNVQKELAYRVEFGNESDVRLLLGKDGNPNGVNELGWPLVSIAARRTDGLAVKIVDILVKAGADINQGGPSRQFPIVIAARNGNVELAQYLLEQGADDAVRDRNGVQPVDIAKYYGHDEVYDIFEELALKRAEIEEKRRSPERFEELRRQLVLDACAAQYMGYYFKTGQDKFSEEHIHDEMADYQTQLTTDANDLYQIFKMDFEVIQDMRNYGATEVYKQLEALISNRNRRAHGVGTEKDRNERCGKIADAWEAKQKAKDDKAQKKEEVEKQRRGVGAIVPY